MSYWDKHGGGRSAIALAGVGRKLEATPQPEDQLIELVVELLPRCLPTGGWFPA